MNAQKIANEAKRTGVVWLGGEMEFPANEGPAAAYLKAVHVAECCGYVVSWEYGRSAFTVIGGDIQGKVVVDWFRPDATQLVKVEVWSCESAYLVGVTR